MFFYCSDCGSVLRIPDDVIPSVIMVAEISPTVAKNLVYIGF